MRDLRSLDICFLAGSLGRGGSEQQLYNMLRTLHGSGARVRVVSLVRGGYWEGPVRALGIPFIQIAVRRPRALRLAGIVRALRRDPPRIVQSQHLFTNLYAAAAARVLGCRDIGAVRGDVGASVARLGGIVGPMSLKLPARLAINSHRAVRDVADRGVSSSKLCHLPNVVDTDIFAPSPTVQRQSSRLLFVGRLIAQKRADRFLRIVARLQTVLGRPVQGIVVGGAPDPSVHRTLRRQVAGLGLSPDSVDFLGELPTELLLAEYRRATALVLTSDTEGTPNVVLEAMATGLPVVATACGDVESVVVDGETGHVYDVADEDGAVETIAALMTNPSLRSSIGKRARQAVLEDYALANLPDHLQKLYAPFLSMNA